MRSAKKVRLQSTIFHLIGRLISGYRFFSFIQKYLQADWFGAESRSLLAGQLIAAGDAYANVLSAFPFPTIIPILHNCLPAPLWKFRRRNGASFSPVSKKVPLPLGELYDNFQEGGYGNFNSFCS